ncbi:unnamed protein product [Cuscuta campestris]|uniref:DUF8039 domain-containing protein n=1 Tax=Cuscuta campestris TaxID=132261 RepID=A0A484LXI9_9ASTE|nr:unnamed protein product [Cuscuta campestris]
MKSDRRSREYELGVDELLRAHLFQHGIDESYTCWIWHGELNPDDEPPHPHNKRVHDSFDDGTDENSEEDGEDRSFEYSDFMNHVQGDSEPLYLGCNTYTKLKALVKLYNLKAKHGISDSCFSEILLLLGTFLPKGNCLPSPFGEAKKTLCALGLFFACVYLVAQIPPKSTQQNAQAGRAIQKRILRSSPRHKKPEGLSERNELQCHSSPKPELRKSPRLKRKDRPSTLTVVQALSGSRSKNVQSHSTPLPVTPKPKPISDNVQKQIKQKRKREEKPTVLFNDKGQPYGVAAAEMQSYIGVLARTKAPIWFDTWRQVPVTIKNKIWKSVTGQPYGVAAAEMQSYIGVLARTKAPIWFDTWRQVPKVHDEHVKRVKENKYPYRLSRKGYANLEQEWAKTHSGDESVIDRSVTWVLARKDKEGNFKSESTKQKAEEIEFLREQVCSGVLTEEGDDDVLTKALGKPEHSGRVRGQGMHVRKAVYFNLPRSKKQKTQTTVDEQVKEGVRQLLAEEVNNIVASRDAFWMAEIEKLKSEIWKKQRSSPAVPSQEASCSPKFREGGQNQQVARKILKDSFDAELEPLTENNDIGDECNHKLSVAEHVDEKQNEKEREKNESEDQEIDTVEKLVEVGGLKVEKKAEKDISVDVDSGESQMAQLAVGSVDNIVAHAKVYGFSRMDDLTLHAEKLGEEYAKVSITEAIKDDDIRVPIPGEVLTVEQAKGTFVAWPKELIVLDVLPKGKSNLKIVKKKKAPKRLKKAHVQDDEECGQEFQVEFGAEYPLQLKRLWLWAKEALSDDRAHTFVLNKDAFGVEKKLSVFLSDIHALTDVLNCFFLVVAHHTVGSVDKIVAHAKVYGFSRMYDLTLHGEKLGEEYAKVSITEAIKDDDIPVPVPREVLTVEQAKGTFVAWPKELIVLDVLPKGKSNLKTVKKKEAPKRLKKAHVQEDEECGQEFQVEFGAEYPLQLERLWLWAKEALSDDRAHTFVLNKDAFGVEKKLSVFLSDIHALCARGEMAGSEITIYIHCVYELVKKNKMLQMITFVDPGMNHWVLTVVKPNEEVVYYMDPLKRRIDSQEWTEVVDNAIVLYKSTMNTPMLKKKVS